MGLHQAFPNARAARLACILLNRHSPAEIAEAIEILVDVLDLMGGDPDTEPNGDENDGTAAEDEFCEHNVAFAGPGCPLADPDMAVDDRGCDDENDDREHEEPLHPGYGIDQTAGCEPYQPGLDQAALRPHRDRIREKRCVPMRWGGYELKTEPAPFVMPKRRRRKLTKQNDTPAGPSQA